ncbi:helix-turn-helix domain-containing protein [Maribacter aurantiacus]|uniref:Helix-turn-helix transcriptional regulator n=1 Tax=Maribacter aurantiacus TaxID=1882343 RepID=A0A5R8MBZ9_9FLAO|nr:AraC family transcriptional regulator [Maribacter aurantiacus]TLF47091.1 helix-turn-helix transcriptional regulator [Maribacter aurantiacus]
MNTTHAKLNQLNNSLGGSISIFDTERILMFDNHKGTGRIQSVELESGIGYSQFDIKTTETVNLNLKNPSTRGLFFIYCLEGNFTLKLPASKSSIEVDSLRTVILGGMEEEVNIELEPGKKVHFSVIQVSDDYTSETSVEKTEKLKNQLFSQFLKNKKYEYVGTVNLKIKEHLLQIKSISQTGVVRKLLIEGLVHFTLALEILHYKSDNSKKTLHDSTLTKREMLRLEEAIEEIRAKPEFPYSIDYFVRKYGLSAAKLQSGFKVFTGSTVASCIKNQRLDLAEKLIQETDLNVSEIVYTIGFSSRSYFSKIFNKRFKCSPKVYLTKARGTKLSA